MNYTIATVVVVLATFVSAAPAEEEKRAFYDQNIDMTCSSAGDEPLNCTKGHLDNAPLVSQIFSVH